MRRAITIVLVLLAGFVGGFTVGMILRAEQVANVESRIKLRDEEIEGLRKSIDARLQAGPKVDAQIPPDKVTSIEGILRATPSTVNIITGRNSSPINAMYSAQISDVFKSSGWDVNSFKTEGAPNSLILRTTNQRDASAITEALKAAGLKYEAVGWGNIEGSGAADFYIGTPKEATLP